MSGRVLIVGSVALDDVKTPFGEEKAILGGSAVYGSISASCLAPVDIVGVAGEDFPSDCVERLNRRGVDTRGLQIVPGGKTFRWGGRYAGDMDEAETDYTALNVFESFRPAIPDAYREDEIVFLANIDPELQLAVLDQVRRPKIVMCDTMNFWIQSKRDALIEVLKRVNIALMNAGEARQLFGTNSLPEAGAKLLELGLQRAIVKKGEHGVLMFSPDGFFASPAMPLERVLDPTGAGDSFAGGFAGYLARNGSVREPSLRQGIVVGSALASFVVEDFSTRRLERVSPAELEERCRRLTGAMEVDGLRLGD
jgi:sugar/nucleoside kinase (ribokinase family)